jgi:hypothetical protein
MVIEIVLAYLLAIPTLCLCVAYVAPWSIADLPKSFSHGEAFKWALTRMFVEKWYFMVLVAVFWLPVLALVLVVTLVFAALFATVFKDTLDEMIGD